jgi:hypothetical protein
MLHTNITFKRSIKHPSDKWLPDAVFPTLPHRQHVEGHNASDLNMRVTSFLSLGYIHIFGLKF